MCDSQPQCVTLTLPQGFRVLHVTQPYMFENNYGKFRGCGSYVIRYKDQDRKHI